jgi:hypothetical protein
MKSGFAGTDKLCFLESELVELPGPMSLQKPTTKVSTADGAPRLSLLVDSTGEQYYYRMVSGSKIAESWFSEIDHNGDAKLSEAILFPISSKPR